MKKTRFYFALTMTLALHGTNLLAASPMLHSCHLKGVEEPMRCAQLQMPLHYGQDNAGIQTLHVVVANSIRENARPDPLFVLAGGPGQAGSEIIVLLNNALAKVRQSRDIVFIDQRGTGRSGKLICPEFESMQDLPAADSAAAFEQCLQHIKADVSAYTTENSARDIDRVREQLGYQQINVWGGSYGTRLGQTYARLFPQQVRSMILDSNAAPDQILGAWGADAQASLNAVLERCQHDNSCAETYPDLNQEWQQLLERLGQHDAVIHYIHPRTGMPKSDSLSYDNFAETIRMMLYGTDAQARVPLIVDRAFHDDWGPFMQVLLGSQEGIGGAMAVGLSMSVMCAEDMPLVTQALIDKEQAISFVKAAELRQWPHWCELMAVKPAKVVPATMISVPVLLFEGALDPVTPPYRAQSAARYMSHYQLLVADNAAHIVSHLGCAPELMKKFLDEPANKLDGKCLQEIRLPEFVLGNAGVAP